jgi:hypothetical protein
VLGPLSARAGPAACAATGTGRDRIQFGAQLRRGVAPAQRDGSARQRQVAQRLARRVVGHQLAIALERARVDAARRQRVGFLAQRARRGQHLGLRAAKRGAAGARGEELLHLRRERPGVDQGEVRLEAIGGDAARGRGADLPAQRVGAHARRQRVGRIRDAPREVVRVLAQLDARGHFAGRQRFAGGLHVDRDAAGEQQRAEQRGRLHARAISSRTMRMCSMSA